MRRAGLLLVAAGALWAPPARGASCDDFVEGAPPKTFLDKTRWDVGVRGEAPFDASIGGRVAVEYSIIPNADVGLRADYGYERGGVQTVVLSAEARIYPWKVYGGEGANVCGYKMRIWTYGKDLAPRFLLSGAPYFLLSVGGGLDLAPKVSGAWNGRLGAGWEFYLSDRLALFVEAGGAIGAMNGFFGSIGLRW